MLEHEIAQVIERGRAGALAEAEDQEVGSQRVHVAALEGVVGALLLGAVVQDPRVLETRVVPEQRLDEQFFRPADPVPHRADDGVLADHDADVAREEQIGKRRQRKPGLVQGAGDGPGLLERALHHDADELVGGELRQLLRQGVGRDDFEGAGHQELAYVNARDELRQECTHLVHLGEALEHRDEPAVLPLGQLQVDDVVVQVVGAVARRDREQLRTGGVDQHGPQRADLGGDADAGHGRNLTGHGGAG